MKRLLHAYIGHFYIITSFLNTSVARFGRTSALLSVEKEALGTLYTGSRVSGESLL
jgi:hypothetical protein